MKPHTTDEEIKICNVAKRGLLFLFISLMIALGILVWLLVADGFTLVRLLVTIVLLTTCYFGGVCHGMVDCKLDQIRNERQRYSYD
jgi:hypothetical protein